MISCISLYTYMSAFLTYTVGLSTFTPVLVLDSTVMWMPYCALLRVFLFSNFMQVPQVCLLSGPTWLCVPSQPNQQDIRGKTVHIRFIFSFAVATHHLLREIRVNHRNIKEADIYLEYSCVCVCLCLQCLLDYSVLYFSLPVSSSPCYTPTNTVPTHPFVVHFGLPVLAGIRFTVTGRDGGNRTRGSKRRRNKERMTE